jgi:sugar phosphate permease
MGQQDISREPLGRDGPVPELPSLRAGVSLLRPTWIRYRILLAVCVLAVIVYIHRVGFASAARWLRPELGLNDDTDWSALMWAFLLAYGGFEVPWGLAGDRFGARNLLAIVTLGSSFLTAAVALAVFAPAGLGAFAVMWGLRFAFGLFQAGVFPSLSRLMADWMPTQERASAQGMIWMSTRVGGALAPLIIVPLIGLTGTWHLPFVLVAGLGLAWCAACWPWFRNRPEESPAVNDAERRLIAENRAAPLRHGGMPWGRVLRCRSVWALCAMYACGGFAATFFVTLLPGYLSKQRQLPDDVMKWLSSLPLACGVVACVLGGVISDFIIRRTGNRRWGRRLPGMVGALISGTALLLTIWAREPWELGALLCLTFFCNDLGMGPAWASCADVGRRYAGTIGGAMNMLGNLAAAGGMALAGGLFQREQPHVVFVIFACSFWLASLCWLAVDVTRPVVETE